MCHLSLERLAALLDEPPSPQEASHLEICADCREELEALAGDRAALGELPDLLPPPPAAWPALEARLEEEGLICAERTTHAPGASAGWLLRRAASLALFLAGGLGGYLLRGELAPAPATEVAAAAPARSREEAQRALEQAESAYAAALARYAELADDPSAADPLTRLAALETIVRTTREALAAAPADPVINGYHMTALQQRDAAVRQLVLATNDRWY
jgi:hypothetical protein